MVFSYIFDSFNIFFHINENSDFDKELFKIKVLIFKEDFTNALNFIENIKKSSITNPWEELLVQMLKNVTMINISPNQYNISDFDSLKRKFILETDIENQIISTCIDIVKADALSSNKNVTESQNLIENILASLELIELTNYKDLIFEMKSTAYFIKGKNLKKLNELDKCIEFLNNSVEIWKNNNNNLAIGFPFYLLADLYHKKEEYSLSLEYLEKSFQYFNKMRINGLIFKNENKLARIYNNMGFNFWRLGNLKKALEKMEIALHYEIAKDLKISFLINLGLIHFEIGNLDESLNYSIKCLDLIEELDNLFLKSTVLNNIGMIYKNKGELDLSLEYYNKSLNIAERIKDKHLNAQIMNNLGILYQYKGDFELSYNFYYQAMYLFSELNNKVEEAISLNNLINISLIIHSNTKTDQLFIKLNEIKENDKENNKVILQSYKLSEAIIKKSKLRFADISSAQNIYKEIINDVIIKHDYTVLAILNLCEILLTELKFSGQQTVLQEVTQLIDKLYSIAKSQNSFILLSQSYMLLSKIAILNLDVELAKSLLNLGLTTAEERGYKHLANMMTDEVEAQQDMIKKINSVDKIYLTLDFLLDLTEIESFVSRIIKNKVGMLPYNLIDEEPRLLIIFAKSGIPLFSNSFDHDQTFNASLISGFLGAINMFLQETFNTTGTLERITHKEYTLLFSPKDKLIFCYVFKGTYHKAVKKLEDLTAQMFSSKEISNEIQGALTTGRALHSNKLIIDLVNEIFYKK